MIEVNGENVHNDDDDDVDVDVEDEREEEVKRENVDDAEANNVFERNDQDMLMNK